MEGFADIDGPVRLGLPWLAIFLGLAGLVGFVGLVRLVRLLRQRPPAAAAPQRSPLEIALERLARLRAGAGGMPADPFVVEVADIVRDYLEAALSVPAREQTSEEFLHAIGARDGLPAVLREKMPLFLEQCDRVKFARQALADDQRSVLLQTAAAVVGETDRSLLAQPAEAVP